MEVFERLKASTMKPLAPRQQYRSCDLRILETTTSEGWRTTRRLVISSSAAEKPKPWCIELFMPLTRVQINRQGLPRQAMVKWSDCLHEKFNRTDGNYNTVRDNSIRCLYWFVTAMGGFELVYVNGVARLRALLRRHGTTYTGRDRGLCARMTWLCSGTRVQE